MKAQQLNELPLQSLQHERGSVNHVQVLQEVCASLAIDPDRDTPGRTVPPPEERKRVTTAIGATRAEQVRGEMRRSTAMQTHPHDRSRRSVLVAEDTPAMRDALRSVLELEGYHVTAVPNGREALDVLATLDPRPQVVIVDLNMPTMDGFAFREEQIRREQVAHLPVIALTGHAGLRRHALHMGFTAALQKPYDVAMLLSLVAHHCRKQLDAAKRA